MIKTCCVKVVVTMMVIFSLLLFCSFTATGSVMQKKNTRSLSTFSSLQIPFIENRGQTGSEAVRYYAKTFGCTVFVLDDGQITYVLPKNGSGKEDTTWILKERFVSGSVCRVEGERKSHTSINYFKGKDPSQWEKNIPAYQYVNFGEVYKGVSVKLKAQGNYIEKIFYIKPGAPAESIQVKIDGGRSVTLDKNGILLVETGMGRVKFSKPIAYQEISGQRNYVDVAYKVQGYTYGFTLGTYDRTKELVIDPVLAATLLGTTGDKTDYVNSIALDSSGNVYVAGQASSSEFPTTTGAYSESYNDSSDVFVVKFDSKLETLLAATLYGGDSGDRANAISVDSGGNVYVAGTTGSNDLPTTPDAFQPEHRLGRVGTDAFVAKFDANLQNLLAATYLSGSDGGAEDEAYCIALDTSGNVYVGGDTDSPNFPVTPSAYDTDHPADPNAINPSNEAFIAKLDGNLQNLLASTFLGGDESSDVVHSLAIDSSGNLYAAGNTFSSDFPTTSGVYDTVLNGQTDAFIVQFDSNLQNLLASTLLGGSSGEILHDYSYAWQSDRCMVLDSSGNIYVTGDTTSEDFPITPGALNSEYAGYTTTFIAKVDAKLEKLLASSFLCLEDHYSIALDAEENVFIAGVATQYICDAPADACQQGHENGRDDAYILKVDTNLTKVLAATFFGGEEQDAANCIIKDSTGNMYVAGWTQSSDFPTTDGAYDTKYNGDSRNIFVAKFDSNLCSKGVTTTTTVDGQNCPTEVIYGEYSKETELLRYLRDNILSQGPEGQEIIRLYYEWSPVIVKAMKEDEEFKEQVKEMVDGVLPLIKGEIE